MFTHLRIAPTSRPEDADGVDPLEARALGGALALPGARRCLPAGIVPDVWERRRFEEALEGLLRVASAPSGDVAPSFAAAIAAEVAEARRLTAASRRPFVAFRGIAPWTEEPDWETEEWVLHESLAGSVALWADGPRRTGGGSDPGAAWDAERVRSAAEAGELAVARLPAAGRYVLRLTDDPEEEEGEPPVIASAGPFPLDLPTGRVRIGDLEEGPAGRAGDPPVRVAPGRYLVRFDRFEGATGTREVDPDRADVRVWFARLHEGAVAPAVPGPGTLIHPAGT